MPNPGSITEDIIRLLDEADLVIADLTGRNPNVVYELGVRHTINKPTIQTTDKGQDLPFDLVGERTIFFKRDSVRSVAKAKNELKAMTKVIETDGFVSVSPVSRAIGLQLLERSGSAGKHLASILQEIINANKAIESVSDQQSMTDVTVDSIESEVSDIKDALETLVPHRIAEGRRSGLYIDDGRLIRLFEDIELYLRRVALRR
jgi:hypothetical protein